MFLVLGLLDSDGGLQHSSPDSLSMCPATDQGQKGAFCIPKSLLSGCVILFLIHGQRMMPETRTETAPKDCIPHRCSHIHTFAEGGLKRREVQHTAEGASIVNGQGTWSPPAWLQGPRLNF